MAKPHTGNVTFEKVRLPYLEAGPSDVTEAAVFVRGDFGFSRGWEDLLERTGQVGRAVAPDVSDFGDEAGKCARCLDGFLLEVGIERAHLVLHGHGGPCGLSWACEHPEAFASVTLISSDVMVADDLDEGIRQTADVMKIDWRRLDLLRSLRRPALVLWGARDIYLPVRFAERQREVFPGARVVVLENSRHWPLVDDPESVADEVVLFLRRHLAAGG